jgi:hypothetical protein
VPAQELLPLPEQVSPVKRTPVQQPWEALKRQEQSWLPVLPQV